MLRERPARVEPRRNGCQTHRAHQALRPLAVDPVSTTPHLHHHLAAAIEVVKGVLLVYQVFEQHIDLNDQHRLTVCINSGPGHTSKRALALLRQRSTATDPIQSCHGRLIPDFF